MRQPARRGFVRRTHLIRHVVGVACCAGCICLTQGTSDIRAYSQKKRREAQGCHHYLDGIVTLDLIKQDGAEPPPTTARRATNA